MTKGIQIALIVAAAILIATAALIYFSPYQSCLRGMKAAGDLGAMPGYAEVRCARDSN